MKIQVPEVLSKCVKGNKYCIELMIGESFGDLTIIGDDGRRKTSTRGSRMVRVRCKCGKEFSTQLNNFVDKVKRNNALRCQECYYASRLSETLFQKYYTFNLKRRCSRKGYDLGVNQKDLQDQWQKQGGICALTGLHLELSKITPYWQEGQRKYLSTGDASLDRIDSSKGYILGNIQWVHKDVNVMKMDLSQDRFISICRMVVEYHKGTPEPINTGISENDIKRITVECDRNFKTTTNRLAFTRIILRLLSTGHNYHESLNCALAQIIDMQNAGE